MSLRGLLLAACSIAAPASLADGELNVSSTVESVGAGIAFRFADPQLGELGRQLLAILKKVGNSDAFVFGHHATDMLGQHWTNYDSANDSSDVKKATGSFPGMFEYNLQWVSMPSSHNIHWDAALSKVKGTGALLMLHWAVDNPSTCTTEGGAVKKCESKNTLTGTPIKDILPGGKVNWIWRQWMDNVANFLHKCASHGLAVILRLFHECTGGWFWWGRKMATPAQYKEAWKYTKKYLTDEKGVHNALFAYAPSKPMLDWSLAYGSGSMYPGDEHVDIVCFDHYGPNDFHEDLLKDCDHVVTFAQQHQKVPAICEFGVADGSQETKIASWFKSAFLDPVMKSDKCRRIAYALTWANRSPESYWVPLPAQKLYPGFKAMAESGHIIFAGDSRLKASAEDGVVDNTTAAGFWV